MTVESQKICMVVMGFGIKADPETGTKYNLDKTYENIIEPAVTGAGLKCWRADQIANGVIDKEMFRYLLEADLVIADLTTANPNALYELGVRHAFRPYATIIMQEESAKFHFDISHNVHFRYRHLGADIGATEAREKTRSLKDKITEVMSNPETDSPVYIFMPDISAPYTATRLRAAMQEIPNQKTPPLRKCAIFCGRYRGWAANTGSGEGCGSKN